MAFYSEEIIRQLKTETDIAAVISQFVPLKPSGTGRFVGLCPFHDDKTPSMSVNPSLGIYKCFACGAGGDVFKFVEEHEKIDFRSAVEWVANFTGFPLPALGTPEKQEIKEEKELVKSLNVLAFRWFQEQLQKSKMALNYLKDRHISEETLKTFGFGFAPDTREGFLSYVAKKGFSPLDAVKAGLAVERETGGISDKFKNRLMIPIRNLSGTVIAFGGRILAKDSKAPKYMNSPETALYTKGDVLYGLYESKQFIQQKNSVIIVEGYFDLISLYQAGIKNVVAASGTALTEMHAGILSRYTKNVYLVFDGDAAGKKATNRSLEIVLSKSMLPKVFSLSRPNGEKIDPDNFIQENGAEAFLNALESATNWLDYLIEENPHETPEERSTFIHKVKEIISGIEDKELARQYLQILSERFGTEASLQGIKRKKKILQPEKVTPQALPERPLFLVQTHELRYLNLVLKNGKMLEAASLVFDMELALHGVMILDSPLISEILASAIVYKNENGTLNLKLFLETLPDEAKELLARLPEEIWKEETAEKEFMEMTLDLERRYAEKLKLSTQDVDFKYEIFKVSKQIEKIIIETRKGLKQSNQIFQNILRFRQNLIDLNKILKGE